MSKKKVICVALATIIALSSCSLFGPSGETGTVTVNFRPGASSKALGDSVDFLPLFSSATLTISGPDMADVSVTVSADSGVSSASLEVPAGNDRVVEISVVPNWTLTQTVYPDSAMITFVAAYGGSATVNVRAHETTDVHISLGVTETRIVLPDSYTIYFADSVGGSPLSSYSIAISSSTNRYFAFDRYGRLFLVNGAAAPALYLYANPTTVFDTPVVGSFNYPIAYSRSDNALYLLVGIDLLYFDLTSGTGTTLNLPITFSDLYAVTVDGDGLVYIAGVAGEIDNVVAKLRVDTSAYSADLLAQASYESLGLAVGTLTTNLTVEDMTIRSERLYIAAGEHDSEYTNGAVHHGKIVEARLSDLSKTREIGWSAATPIPSPSTQFYGPKRFLALAPRKLIVADEGNSTGAYGGDLDRVVEVDLDSWSVSGVGLEGVVGFFSTYQC